LTPKGPVFIFSSSVVVVSSLPPFVTSRSLLFFAITMHGTISFFFFFRMAGFLTKLLSRGPQIPVGSFFFGICWTYANAPPPPLPYPPFLPPPRGFRAFFGHLFLFSFRFFIAEERTAVRGFSRACGSFLGRISSRRSSLFDRQSFSVL